MTTRQLGNLQSLKLDDILHNLHDKVVIFNFEGTVCRYSADSCSDANIDLYSRVLPVNTVCFFLRQLNINNMWILATTKDYKKRVQQLNWIYNTAVRIDYDHVVFLNEDDERPKMLQTIMDLYEGKEFVYVDSCLTNLSIIQNAAIPIELLHTSAFLV